VRALLRAADELARALARGGPGHAGRRPARLRERGQVRAPRLSVLASSHAGRAPPAYA
jgi:hypothetical protein